MWSILVSTSLELETQCSEILIPGHGQGPAVDHGKHALRSQQGVKAWEGDLPLKPVNARSRGDQRIGREKRHLFQLATNPVQMRMIPIGQLFAARNHVL